MRPRFQADADFNQKIVAGLRRREPAIDFRSARDGGVIGRPDPEVLAQAASDDRVLVSHDRQTMPGHFRRLIETSASPGLVIVSQDLDIGQAIEELLLVWAASEAEEWENTVIFLAAVISGSGSGGGRLSTTGILGKRVRVLLGAADPGCTNDATERRTVLAPHLGHVSNFCGIKRGPLEPLQLLLGQWHPRSIGRPI